VPCRGRSQSGGRWEVCVCVGGWGGAGAAAAVSSLTCAPAPCGLFPASSCGASRPQHPPPLGLQWTGPLAASHTHTHTHNVLDTHAQELCGRIFIFHVQICPSYQIKSECPESQSLSSCYIWNNRLQSCQDFSFNQVYCE